MEEETMKAQIYALKTTVGQEKTTADMIAARASNFNLPVHAIFVPSDIKGYIFIEAKGGKPTLERVRSGVKHARGIVSGEVNISEIEQFFTPKPSVTGMEVGDVVELIAGPFRGERARITRIDEGKEEITVELLESTVPIPVTVRGDTVKVIQKKEESK
ncbi:MAG: transcription elongation factor Spt5 [Candidatus Hadarchaeales archaeon]